MRRALLFAAAGLLAVPVAAQQVTKTFDYKPVDSIQDIRLTLDKVRINQIVFKVGESGAAAQRRSTSEAVVRIDNESEGAVAVGVAVAVKDEEGNLVAAGSGGTRAGWLRAGERGAATIKFPFVFRNLAKAKTFTITMEVEPKAAAAAAPAEP
jgi:hypothetical protein